MKDARMIVAVDVAGAESRPEALEDRTSEDWSCDGWGGSRVLPVGVRVVSGEELTGGMRRRLSVLSPNAVAGGGIRTVDVLFR